MNVAETSQSRLAVLIDADNAQPSITDSGWAHLGAVGNNIAKQASDFDPRNYGFSKLGELVKAINLFDLDGRVSRDGHSKTIYIRDKRQKPPE